MRHFILGLALLAAGTGHAFAFGTPEALLKAVYAPYFITDYDWSKFDETKYRSKELNALVAKDEKEADGGIGRLDFDPFIAGQDYTLSKLKIARAKIKGKTATDEVTFDNQGAFDDLLFSLVQEADGWKIDDVVSSGKGQTSLKQLLEGPMQ